MSLLEISRKERFNMQKFCNCGSNNYSFWIHDARGIPLVKACDSCEEQKLKKYRPEVLTNSEYECCEEIDEDY